MLLKYKVIAFLTFYAVVRESSEASITNPDWWKHAVFYQIYPRSFKDSNNDGIGDLKGIISKLDHLKDAGITAAWLSPIYRSPQVDQGYDISNFREIEPAYGTMDDFIALVREAHAKGIKIIMDFVPNHSSVEHEWFKASENGTRGYEDFYVWRNGTENNPPNNWISIFKYSAWKYSSKRKQYYLHQFAEAQPDLNYRSPNLVAQMKDVLKFWLDKGVDGFRMDAVPFIYEDERFKDEPRSNIPNVDNYLPNYLKHVYTQNQPETFNMIYEFREVLDLYNNAEGGDPRIMMTEAYADIDNTMYYYGNEAHQGAHFTFNFLLITNINKESNARDLAYTIKKWLKSMPKRYVANWVLGNHDNHRVASRFGPENIDGFNMLIAFLPGIMVTYNGEEIGQEDGEVTYAQGQDPNACNAPPEDFATTSRDFERTPFQWDNSTNAGFNNGTKPWLPVSSKYLVTNLAAQQDPNKPSHYQVYKQLVKLRQKNAFKNSDANIKAIRDEVLVFSRGAQLNKSYLVIINLSAKNLKIRIDGQFKTTPYLEVVVASVTSARKRGDLISVANIQLVAHESLVVRLTSKTVSTATPTPPLKNGN